ncbi:AzlD domain-containing protein [Nocardioides insulae]|uniref:AzlD domain-containing protein n=1 Tax=Nocardioides insulae TaxID=394734 RepID=UPI0003FEFF43|nr:AzlD domain-containing protein [Nocardioides insulae]
MSEQAVLWAAILVSGVASYALKLAGLSVPERVLAHPLATRVAALIPVALLAALIAVQVLGEGRALVLDARVVGLAAAVVMLLLRAPFLVVVFGAAAVAALVRLV